MNHLGHLPVHLTGGPDYLTPIRLGDSLVAEAHAEHRDTGRARSADQLNRDTGLSGRARSGGNDDGAWSERDRLSHRDAIVPHHDRIGTEFAQILDEVVRERVIVVENQ